jgi:four helix bundle protein
MSNIAEGHGRGGKREFIQFLSIARGSAFEVISHLYVALDQVYIDQQSFGSLSSLAEEVCKMSSGLIRYLNDTAIRGTKYKQTEN